MERRRRRRRKERVEESETLAGTGSDWLQLYWCLRQKEWVRYLR